MVKQSKIDTNKTKSVVLVGKCGKCPFDGGLLNFAKRVETNKKREA